MFVTFEGIEGSGKSTALRLVAERLRRLGFDPALTREPGATGLGRRLRPMLLDARCQGLCARAELFLFMADRAQHVEELIRPDLEAGRIVLCDRYADSTMCYQGAGRGLDLRSLELAIGLSTGGLRPDVTFLLDVPAQIGLERAGRRNRQEGTVLSEGRFDSESLAFHERVRQGYLELAAREPERIVVIDAEAGPGEVAARCMATLEPRLRA